VHLEDDVVEIHARRAGDEDLGDELDAGEQFPSPRLHLHVIEGDDPLLGDAPAGVSEEWKGDPNERDGHAPDGRYPHFLGSYLKA
jgi:hypothetical protein